MKYSGQTQKTVDEAHQELVGLLGSDVPISVRKTADSLTVEVTDEWKEGSEEPYKERRLSTEQVKKFETWAKGL